MFIYNANGSLTTRTRGQETLNLSYDAEGRLVNVTGSKTAAFAYDGDSYQVKGSVNTTETVYVNPLYEVQGTTIRKYYYAGAQKVAMRENGTLHFLIGDNLGSESVTLSPTGTVEAELKYKAWGEQRYSNGTTPTKYQYTGQRNESDLGLYFYKSRWYEPALGRFVQADTIVPGAGNPQAYDRYAYSLNNPINFSDPTGHWPEWIDDIGDFFTGVSAEFTRTNNWIGAITSPRVAQSLEPSSSESDAMLIGRIIGDIATIVLGVGEISSGIGIAGGGAAVGCGTTLCLASAPAIAAGSAVITYGAGTVTSGSTALGENLGRMYSRSKNDLKPDPNATGPHSTFKRDPLTGKVTNYETYQPQTNPQNPNPWEKILRYDGIGKAHPNTITRTSILPHVHVYLNDTVRSPFRHEIPNFKE